MSLKCRGTFLEVVDLESPSDRHRHSLGAASKPEWESQDKLLQKAADSFAWQLDTPISCGSYGHPELCASPCIRAFYSKCTKGFLCEFCHLGHAKRKCNLNRIERQFLDGLDERELLSLMLSLLRDKCGKLPGAQQDVLQLLLAAVQYRVKSLQNTSTLLVEAPNRAMLPLRRFSLGRFFEVIQQSHQIDVNFKMEIKRLATSARTAVHSTNSRSAQAGRRMDAEWHDSATCN